VPAEGPGALEIGKKKYETELREQNTGVRSTIKWESIHKKLESNPIIFRLDHMSENFSDVEIRVIRKF